MAAVRRWDRVAPNANAYAERWIRTVRVDCLDWLLIVGRGIPDDQADCG